MHPWGCPQKLGVRGIKRSSWKPQGVQVLGGALEKRQNLKVAEQPGFRLLQLTPLKWEKAGFVFSSRG